MNTAARPKVLSIGAGGLQSLKWQSDIVARMYQHMMNKDKQISYSKVLYNRSLEISYSDSEAEVKVTELRMNQLYVTWYHNWARTVNKSVKKIKTSKLESFKSVYGFQCPHHPHVSLTFCGSD